MSLFSGIMADQVSFYKQVYIFISLTLLALLAMLVCQIYGNYYVFFHILIAFFVPFFTIPIHVKIQSLFKTRIRMRMCSLSHAVGSMIFSSSTPLICMLIWRYTNSFSIIISLFAIQIIVILVSLIYIHRKQFPNELD